MGLCVRAALCLRACACVSGRPSLSSPPVHAPRPTPLPTPLAGQKAVVGHKLWSWDRHESGSSAVTYPDWLPSVQARAQAKPSSLLDRCRCQPR